MENLNFKYDKRADVLYAYLGAPRAGYAEEPFDGILIRRDVKTKEIIGFTIINYSLQKKAGRTKSIPYFESIEIPY